MRNLIVTHVIRYHNIIYNYVYQQLLNYLLCTLGSLSKVLDMLAVHTTTRLSVWRLLKHEQ